MTTTTEEVRTTMSKIVRVLVIVIALVAFAMTSVALADEFYVVKDKAGKMTVVDKKPADAASVAKGPFKTKAEAEKAMADLGKAKVPATKPAPPVEGC